MLRKITGNVLVAAFGVAFFAKAATSFPILPRPADLPLPATPDNLLVEVVDDALSDGLIAEAEEDVPSPMFGNKNADFPKCETPEVILQALEQERAVLTQQADNVKQREAKLALASEKLAIEKDTLSELKTTIEQLLGKIEDQKTADLERLVALYQNMKPAEAAEIMNDMDIEVMIMVLGTMQPRVAAPILAKMSPVRARAVSKIILERSKLPGDQKLNGVRFN